MFGGIYKHENHQNRDQNQILLGISSPPLLTSHRALVVLVGPHLVILCYALTMAFMTLTLETALNVRPQVIEADGAGFGFCFSQSPQPLHLLVVPQTLELLKHAEIGVRNKDWLIFDDHLLLPRLFDLFNCIDD